MRSEDSDDGDGSEGLIYDVGCLFFFCNWERFYLILYYFRRTNQYLIEKNLGP